MCLPLRQRHNQTTVLSGDRVWAVPFQIVCFLSRMMGDVQVDDRIRDVPSNVNRQPPSRDRLQAKTFYRER